METNNISCIGTFLSQYIIIIAVKLMELRSPFCSSMGILIFGLLICLRNLSIDRDCNDDGDSREYLRPH